MCFACSFMLQLMFGFLKTLKVSFDLEISKAPMVLDGGKAKGGGHLTLIYLTFISTKIRHVLASLSDIQQQQRCLGDAI